MVFKELDNVFTGNWTKRAETKKMKLTDTGFFIGFSKDFER